MSSDPELQEVHESDRDRDGDGYGDGDESNKLNWPPTDSDFIKVAKWAFTQKTDFKNVLVYVKYSPEDPILIYDPVHIGPGPREIRSLTVKYGEQEEEKTINVILAEND